MRTTIDLPDATHARLVALARERGLPLGKFLAELADRALLAPDRRPGLLDVDPLTGLLTFGTGVPITHEEVRDLLDEDAD